MASESSAPTPAAAPASPAAAIAPLVTLNDGRKIPCVGFGVWQNTARAGIAGREGVDAVLTALSAGYRHIDTAAMYGNEAEVGQAVRESGIPREDIWLTTKVKTSDLGYDATLAAAEKSLKALDIGYIDLYLIHAPADDSWLDSWRALEKLHSEGLIKSIGISNCGVRHLEALEKVATVIPAVNQIEVHPFLTREALVAKCKEMGIAVSAFCPLLRAKRFDNPTLVSIATAVGKTPAQVLLRWSVQKGYIPLPMSSNPARIAQNIDVFDFSLSDDQMKSLDGLDEGFLASSVSGGYGQLEV